MKRFATLTAAVVLAAGLATPVSAAPVTYVVDGTHIAEPFGEIVDDDLCCHGSLSVTSPDPS